MDSFSVYQKESKDTVSTHKKLIYQYPYKLHLPHCFFLGIRRIPCPQKVQGHVGQVGVLQVVNLRGVYKPSGGTSDRLPGNSGRGTSGEKNS